MGHEDAVGANDGRRLFCARLRLDQLNLRMNGLADEIKSWFIAATQRAISRLKAPGNVIAALCDFLQDGYTRSYAIILWWYNFEPIHRCILTTGYRILMQP